MKKSITLLLALGLVSLSFGRVGPVSQYGQLQAGKNSQGKGRIYGSCEGVKDGAEVQVRGMSLYWSMVPKATEFWTSEGISTMVSDMNIQIVRAAMGTNSNDWWGCKDGSEDGSNCEHITGYATDAEFQTNLMNTVVQAAIDNDIYVIIDWHSHEAHQEVSNASKFFAEMAQKWGRYDHVIFELYNEPIDASWNTVKSYAETIVPIIRQYSDNLILVGNRMYDQNPQEAIGNTVSGDNIAYTFHYYANSHCWSGTNDGGNPCEGANAQQAIDAGLSVFVSEWGTANADGGGNPDQGRNTSWQNWMDDNQLSWANWSASKVDEGTAAFQGSSNRYGLSYTTSGNLVKGYLASNPTSYTACAVISDKSSSSKVASSSSSTKVVSSSSSAKESVSSSSAKSSSSRYGDDEDDDDNEPETVESLDDVKCTSKKEGEIITVAEEDADYYCYKKEWIEIVSSTKKLPNCTAKREGLSIYVERDDEVVTCEDEEWLSVDDDRTAIASGVDRLAGLSATIHGNTLQVTVERAGLVKVQVFDMMGHIIESHSESMAAGSFAHTFGSMGKGAYIVRVQQGSMAKTIRMQVR